MSHILKLNVGRERVTVATLPSEAGYVRSIRAQMEMLRKNMEKVVEHVELVTAESIEFGLKPIFEESQRLVPVDTGRLKRSGFIVVRRVAGGSQAAIGYGKFGRPFYTAFVHENLNVRHAQPTQAKFLEAAVQKKLADFGRRVALFIQKSMPGIER